MSYIPLGVVGIFTNAEGRVVASVSEFAQDRPGGDTVREAQTMRAKRRLASAVADAYCSSDFTKALDNYDCEKIMDVLCSAHGCKANYVLVGSENEVA